MTSDETLAVQRIVLATKLSGWGCLPKDHFTFGKFHVKPILFAYRPWYGLWKKSFFPLSQTISPIVIVSWCKSWCEEDSLGHWNSVSGWTVKQWHCYVYYHQLACITFTVMVKIIRIHFCPPMKLLPIYHGPGQEVACPGALGPVCQIAFETFSHLPTFFIDPFSLTKLVIIRALGYRETGILPFSFSFLTWWRLWTSSHG